MENQPIQKCQDHPIQRIISIPLPFEIVNIWKWPVGLSLLTNQRQNGISVKIDAIVEYVNSFVNFQFVATGL